MKAMSRLLVVSSNPRAYGLLRAKRRSVPTMVFDNKVTKWTELIDTLKSFGIENIMLAGFMKILPKEFVKAFEGRIFNIHPSVLPDYPGIKSIEKAFNDNKHSGCSLHRVPGCMFYASTRSGKHHSGGAATR